MPASLRDVRVVSPAVNLPGPLAAALLFAGCGFAERHGLIPRARFGAVAIAGTDPVVQFTAVLDATRGALKPVGDIGLFKVNEVFTGVPLVAQGEFGIPDGNLNVNGAPPPSGTRSARPARMLTDLSRELERYGFQAICGTASAAVIERQ